MNQSGIYKIQSLIKKERIYIGSAINLKNRKACHLSKLRLGKHANKKLQNHYNKYGADDLIFTVLEYCKPSLLIKKEQEHINFNNPFFNINPIAGSSLGRKTTEETKQKMRKPRRNFVPWNKGIKCSEETKIKISKINKGMQNMLGKHHSEESKRKMSISRTGLKRSQETKDKIRIALTNKKFTETHKKNISISKIGNKYRLKNYKNLIKLNDE